VRIRAYPQLYARAVVRTGVDGYRRGPGFRLIPSPVGQSVGIINPAYLRLIFFDKQDLTIYLLYSLRT